jgi:polynucleotide 5'-kinase involved in rRNA processing
MLTNDIDDVVQSLEDIKEQIESLLYVQSMMDQKHFSRDDYRLQRLKAISDYLDVELNRLKA